MNHTDPPPPIRLSEYLMTCALLVAAFLIALCSSLGAAQTPAETADRLRDARDWADEQRSVVFAREGQSERWRQAQRLRDLLVAATREADDLAEMVPPVWDLDATSGRQLPALERLHIEYEFQRATDTDAGGIYEDGDRSKVWGEDYARRALRFGDAQFVCLDIENLRYDGVWSGAPSDEQIAANREQIGGQIDVARAVLPDGVKLTVYGLGTPAYSLHNPNARAAEVEAYAALLAPQVELLDYVTVVLYDRADGDLESWTERAEKKVAYIEATFGKPVIALVWHRYHDKHLNAELRGQPIPLDDWKRRVAWARQRADVVAYWDHQPIEAEHRTVMEGLQ